MKLKKDGLLDMPLYRASRILGDISLETVFSS